jgi:hypothetical protein
MEARETELDISSLSLSDLRGFTLPWIPAQIFPSVDSYTHTNDRIRRFDSVLLGRVRTRNLRCIILTTSSSLGTNLIYNCRQVSSWVNEPLMNAFHQVQVTYLTYGHVNHRSSAVWQQRLFLNRVLIQQG